MKSFELGLIERQQITQNLLRTIRLIGEYKGKQELFKEQSPMFWIFCAFTLLVTAMDAWLVY